MNTDSHNNDVDEYLDGNTGLSKLYSTSKDLKSPAHLNSAIEQLARQSLKEKSRKPGTHQGWKWPVALAASIILGILLGVFYRVDMYKPVGKQLATREATSTPEILPGPKSDFHKAPQPKQATESSASITQTPTPVSITPAPSAVKKPLPAKQSIAQQQEDVPPKLQALLQQTSAGDAALNSLLPDKILKTWTRKQWREQVSKLKSLHRDQLAAQYIKAYPKFFPGESLKADKQAK